MVSKKGKVLFLVVECRFEKGGHTDLSQLSLLIAGQERPQVEKHASWPRGIGVTPDRIELAMVGTIREDGGFEPVFAVCEFNATQLSGTCKAGDVGVVPSLKDQVVDILEGSRPIGRVVLTIARRYSDNCPNPKIEVEEDGGVVGIAWKVD